jgi:hypothetical protein
MADTHIWDGSGSTGVDLPANWQSGVTPVAGDSIIVPAGNDHAIAGVTTAAVTINAVSIGTTGTITVVDTLGLMTGAYVAIAAIVGTVGDILNGNSYWVSITGLVLTPYTDAAMTVPVDTSGKAYTSGGTATRAVPALVTVTIMPGYTGTVGSSTDGKPLPLPIGATTLNLAGTGQSYIDLDANGTATCNVTAAAASPGKGQFGLALTSADTVANLNIDLDSGESVGVAALAGQTATFTNVNIDGGGTVVLGSGMATITALAIRGTGTVYIDCTYTALTINGTPTVYQRSGAGTTLLCQGGRFYNNTTGTITTTSIFPGATVDCTEGPQARAMTTINNYGGLFDDSNARTTWTAINRYCGDECFKLGTNWKMGARAAI